MKRIEISFTEDVRYTSIIEVPDNYPETLEAMEEAEDFPPSGSGEPDWWEQLEVQNPKWVTDDCVEVYDRQLQAVRRVEEDDVLSAPPEP